VRFLLLSLALATLSGPALSQEKIAPPFRLSTEGRLLYANDDDWDWASPLQSKEPCGLKVYGQMPWSALDWMEHGLTEVRGMLVGSPPLLGNYSTMGDLNRLRGAGPKKAYEQVEHRNNILCDLLKGKNPPNVIIFMQDCGPAAPPISAADMEAAWQFVRGGGRLVVLDDWACYHALMNPFLDKKRLTPIRVEPINPKRVKEIETRVQLLGDENFKVREKAFQELVKMGPPILPILAKIRPGTLEAERRLERIQEMLRPPNPILAGGNWMKAAREVMQEIHEKVEVKAIVRDGPMIPGAAICVRMPVLALEKKVE